jgi:hypothetical protein
MPIIQPNSLNNLKKLKGFKDFPENINKKGRPTIPKTIKDFIKSMEMVDDDILIPVDACEKITKKGVNYYKVAGTNGLKMAMNAYNKALKGDIRFLDWITKMGYAGGYTPTKQEVTGKDGESIKIENTEITDLIKLLKNEN